MVERRIKPSPVRLNPLSRERSRFITTIPAVPSTQPIILNFVSFSSRKTSDEISMHTNTLIPSMTEDFTPLVLASPI